MTRRELLFSDETIHQVHRYYEFQQDNFGRKRFDDLISEEYAPKIHLHPRGFTDVVHPYEAFLNDLENYLGRNAWGIFDGDKIVLVHPDFRKFVCSKKDVIVYEEKDVFIRGYESDNNHFHVLLAKAEKSHLGTHKQLRKLIGRLKSKYSVITAKVAEKPCHVVGREDDWRFEKNGDNESRLLRFWRKLGFESFEPNKNVVKIFGSGIN
jgi:hypothetical protein